MYKEGKHGEKDPQRAERWLLRAADHGHVSALNELALLYEGKKEYIKAFDYYKASALKGNPRAQYRLSEIYEFGFWSFKKDIKRAEYWLRKAAEGGHPMALLRFGIMLPSIEEQIRKMIPQESIEEGLSDTKKEALLPDRLGGLNATKRNMNSSTPIKPTSVTGYFSTFSNYIKYFINRAAWVLCRRVIRLN
jgi:hypothetical protein